MPRASSRFSAARIVSRFGLETLDILDSDPGRLSEVPGLGKTRVERVKKAWVEQREIHSIMVFLQSHGISVNGCFILGFDTDDESCFEAVYDFVADTSLAEVQITTKTTREIAIRETWLQ